MKKRLLTIYVFLLFAGFSSIAVGQPNTENIIEIGTFNLEWFPCKDDGDMMKQYGIELRYPPQGKPTDIAALFHLLKQTDIELLAVEEVVDPVMLADSAQKYLGEQFKFIYSPSGGSQKVGFLYDSGVLEVIGSPETYLQVALNNDSRLRPAFGAYFKVKPSGFDFYAVVVHLKASPRGWDIRKKQWAFLEDILKDLPKNIEDKDIILLGDFNDVSKLGTAEFDAVMQRLHYYRATAEINDAFTEYWQPDYKKERIEGSMIDHIFISADAKIEFIENSTRVGGMCADGAFEYSDDSIPSYYENISDHCPVYGSFRVDVDED
ncbi:MAG: hypothetical protein P8X42_13715 [Calditrichaceae bacterium]